jgi:23S rRNA pseudouridine1911/1915/1917 synthase
MESWRVASGEAGRRLDRFVADRVGAARNQVQGWIRDGLVEVDGAPRRASYAVVEGEQIRCTPRAKETARDLEPEAGELSVLYEDADLLALDKPAGLAVHPGAGRRRSTLVHRLLAAYPEIAAVGGHDRPGIVHRLDLDTTGVLLVARSEAAYLGLGRAFARRKVAKTYLGVAFGVPRPASGLIDQPIGRHATRRKEMTVRRDGRPARTAYRVLAPAAAASLLELDLQTGRTHQIRVHLKAIGHPLVGDAVYGGNRWRGAPKPVRPLLQAFPRPALHAWRIEVRHPIDGRALHVEAPVPADLEALWRELGSWPAA